MKIKTKFSFASFALFSVKLCLTRPNDFSLLKILGLFGRCLYCHVNVLLSEETSRLTFISRYSRLISPFRSVQHYYKPLTIFIFIVFMPCSINTRQANTVDLEIGLYNVLSNRRWHVCYLILAFNVFLYHWLPKITLDTFKQFSSRLRDSRDTSQNASHLTESRTALLKKSKAGERKFFLDFFSNSFHVYYSFFFFIFHFLFIQFLSYHRLLTFDN